MQKVVGIRFKPAGKIYYFDPSNIFLKLGDDVIVETAKSTEYGYVVRKVKYVEDEECVLPLKPVIRKATKKDTEKHLENLEKAEEALEICKKEVEKQGLDMKLVRAEYTFNASKIVFYFTADGRIDFRELVKNLAAIFKIRIELRQIGVRDEAKILGGMGPCGCELCCNKWLGEFQPVSIKMAKEQGLSLNPTKISGICGRLLCCLQYEHNCYEDASKRLPKVNDKVETPDGVGNVERLNVLKETFLVKFENDGDIAFKEFTSDDVKIVPKKNGGCGGNCNSCTKKAKKDNIESNKGNKSKDTKVTEEKNVVKDEIKKDNSDSVSHEQKNSKNSKKNKKKNYRKNNHSKNFNKNNYKKNNNKKEHKNNHVNNNKKNTDKKSE